MPLCCLIDDYSIVVLILVSNVFQSLLDGDRQVRLVEPKEPDGHVSS